MSVLFLLPLLATATPAPQEIRPMPALVAHRPAEAGRHVWHTRSFRIDSDQALSPRQLERLAQVADTTATAVRTFPLPIFSPPETERPRIAIYSDDDAYHQAGANADTAGTYNRRRETVLLNARHLFRADPSGRLDPDADEDLVVHELVHLCLHRVEPGLPQWLGEGLAEYFAAAHRGAGRFDFRNLESEIARTIRQRLNLHERATPLVAISDIADLNSRDWTRYQSRMPAEERYRAYATSLILAHYYINGSEARRAVIKAALERPPRRRGSPAPFPELRAEATSLEATLTRYWGGRGLALEFMKPDPLPKKERPRR